MLSHASVDIVLSDISMPEMNGEELLRAIRATGAQVPVLAVTGNVLQDDVSRYLETGFADVVGKPLDPIVLTRWSPRCSTTRRAEERQPSGAAPIH